MTRNKPIFFDRRGRRAKATNLVLVLAALAVCIGAIAIAIGTIIAPHMPRLTAATAVDSQTAPLPDLLPSAPVGPLVVPSRSRQIGREAEGVTRYAFFTHNDAGSVPSLERNCDRIDALIPDWLQLAKPNGRVELSADSRSTEVVSWLRACGPHLSVYPQLSSELSAREIVGALAGADTRSALIEQIADYLRSNDFQGAVVDLPELPPSSVGTVAVFLDQLGARLHAESRKLFLVSEPGDEERRVQELSQLVDYVVILAHDQSGIRAERGPIAPEGWFEARIERQLALIPADKLIISVGSFGYDIDAYSGTRLISAQQAWDIAHNTGAELRLDGRTLNTNFAYKLPDGRVHQVWLLDAVTAFNQVKVALAARPAGIAIWRLGLEDPGVFEFAGRGRVPDAVALTAIRKVEPGFGSFLDTQGALISASPGAPGAREISFNQSLGLIVDQAMKIYPRQVHLSVLRAKDPKAIALTFDDGPDAIFTPKILDVLAQKGVKGTFYLVGRNALMSLDLVRRIEAEGHDIGNHTFSHPNLFHSAPQRIAAELNATQRIFEAELGVGTRLFRPPYSMETYGYLEASPLLIETASRMGYMIGGIEVDPQDYLNKPDRTAEDVIKQVSQGAGQVVLLHDAGGNREATVEALPRIIDALQAAGFHFVTTHDLVGLSRDQVMPPLPPGHPAEQVKAGLWLGSVRTVAWFGAAIPLIAIVTAILGIVRLILIVAGALVHAVRRRSSAAEPLTRFKGSIAVVVPAYNEEMVICKTIRGLLSSTIGRRLKVIVVDDGSNDRTSEVVRKAFRRYKRVKLYRKENGGKARALNFGIAQSDADVIVAIDGDTILTPDAIERLTAHFNDTSVGAVAGKVVVGNEVNLLTRFQALEYTTSQNLDRRAFDLFNAIGVVPGAIGAWRREAVLEAGGYSNDTLAEDADLTVSLERHGWRVVSEPLAVALTEAPETLRGFLKQRFRWTFGTLQVAFKHAGALLKPPSGVSLITIPNVVLFQFGFTFLTPMMDFLLLLSLVFEVAALFELVPPQGDALILIARYWLLFQAIDILAAVTALVLNKDRLRWTLVPLLFLQRFTYRQLLCLTAIRAVLAAAKGVFVGWGKLVRTGTVALPQTT